MQSQTVNVKSDARVKVGGVGGESLGQEQVVVVDDPDVVGHERRRLERDVVDDKVDKLGLELDPGDGDLLDEADESRKNDVDNVATEAKRTSWSSERVSLTVSEGILDEDQVEREGAPLSEFRPVFPACSSSMPNSSTASPSSTNASSSPSAPKKPSRFSTNVDRSRSYFSLPETSSWPRWNRVDDRR